MKGDAIKNRKSVTKLSSRLGLIGAGVGLGLFALFGILYGSLFGGVVGLNVASVLLSDPVTPSVLSRVFVALGMLLGVMISGLVFITGAASVGWLLGLGIEKVTAPSKEVRSEKLPLE